MMSESMKFNAFIVGWLVQDVPWHKESLSASLAICQLLAMLSCCCLHPNNLQHNKFNIPSVNYSTVNQSINQSVNI